MPEQRRDMSIKRRMAKRLRAMAERLDPQCPTDRLSRMTPGQGYVLMPDGTYIPPLRPVRPSPMQGETKR